MRHGRPRSWPRCSRGASKAELKPGVTTAVARSTGRAPRGPGRAGAAPSNFTGYGHNELSPSVESAHPRSTARSCTGSPATSGHRGKGEIVSVDCRRDLRGLARRTRRGRSPVGEADGRDRSRSMDGDPPARSTAGIGPVQCRGPTLGDVGAAVRGGRGGRAATRIVREFVGHGIGTAMHEDPQVPNYRTGIRGMKLAPGICLAIEPMLHARQPRGGGEAGRLDRRH